MQSAQTNIEEQDLIAGLKRGEKKYFEYLYDRYSAALLGIIMRSIPNEDVANDVLQDVFVKIWKNIASYQPEKGRLYTWMLNIARNSSIDYQRSAQNKKDSVNQNLEDSVYHVDSSHQVNQETDVIGLTSILNKLNEDQKAVIELVYLKGYTQDETSKLLNLPLGTVKSRVRSAIIELRKHLSKDML